MSCFLHHWGLRPTAAVVAVFVFLAVGITLPTTVEAEPTGETGDVRGPRCADIVSGSGQYGLPSIEYVISTNSPTCKSVDYSLHVLDSSGTFEVGATAMPGNRGQSLTFFAPLSPEREAVCVYATSSLRSRLLDRYPNSGCQLLAVPPCANIIGGNLVTASNPGPVILPQDTVFQRTVSVTLDFTTVDPLCAGAVVSVTGYFLSAAISGSFGVNVSESSFIPLISEEISCYGTEQDCAYIFDPIEVCLSASVWVGDRIVEVAPDSGQECASVGANNVVLQRFN